MQILKVVHLFSFIATNGVLFFLFGGWICIVHRVLSDMRVLTESLSEKPQIRIRPDKVLCQVVGMFPSLADTVISTRLNPQAQTPNPINPNPDTLNPKPKP